MTAFVVLASAAPDWYPNELRRELGPVLGFEPEVHFVDLETNLPATLRSLDGGEAFILPAALEWNLWQREKLGQIVAEARRANSSIAIHHDDPDPCDSLIVDALAERAFALIRDPRRAAILLAPDGCGDPSSRAQSYRLMRLLWERLGVAAGEVAFVRHAHPFLSQSLDRIDDRFEWVLLPPALWPSETVEYARVILENSKKPFAFAEPPMKPAPGNSRVVAWLAARAIRLWREKRSREQHRVRSVKTQVVDNEKFSAGSAFIARVPDRDAMRAVIDAILPPGPHHRVIVKVTWHGYATGTYTDPAALDLLLSALPARAVIVEGHTSSRNLGDSAFDWETEAQSNRAWIKQQDCEFLRRTGLGSVIARHHAQYINVTECFWNDECCAPEAIPSALHHAELAAFVPRALFDLRGSPMISFAKIKGPTRLAISNLFGLIPHPLRAAWHGPNITHFARVCCDLAKLYGSLFDLVAINEGLYSAVRWDRRGLYRSRWGNYDLISDAGHLIASRNIAAADILASRLQGQEVSRSAFFDVVRAELGWDDAAEQSIVPAAFHTLFV